MSYVVHEQPLSELIPDVLTALHRIAEAEGRPFRDVLNEALREYIERKEQSRLRYPVGKAFDQSLKDFDSLYRELAK